MNMRALGAEFFGTFALVAATCGAALFSAPAGAGLLAQAFAIGLSVLMMAYAVGHVSGGHFNPAVSLGLVASGRVDMGTAVGYIVAQVLGGILAALIFSTILSGAPPAGAGIPRWNGFAEISNTYGGPRGFTLQAVFLTEVVVTALFLIVIMGATSKKAPAGFAPIAIGVALLVLHLVSIPVSNASLNPARSTAPALLATGGTALSQLWVFWVAPIIGGVIGGLIGRWMQDE
jgi:aquaporin Z